MFGMHTEADLKPAFVRMPRVRERCPLTGLSRDQYDALVRPSKRNNYRPPVRSKLWKSSEGRVIRLVDFESLVSYLRNLPDGAIPENLVGSNANKKPGNF